MTYGLERLAMYVQDVENVFALDFNGAGVTLWRRVPAGRAGIQRLQFRARRHGNADAPFRRCREGVRGAAGAPAALPAYDQCIKASHLFNLLDARGVISVTERASYIGRVRALAKGCCEAWLAGDGTGVVVSTAGRDHRDGMLHDERTGFRSGGCMA